MKLDDQKCLLIAAGGTLLLAHSRKTPRPPIPVVLVPPKPDVSAQGGFDDEEFNRGFYTGAATALFAWYAWGKWVKPTAQRMLGSGPRLY